MPQQQQRRDTSAHASRSPPPLSPTIPSVNSIESFEEETDKTSTKIFDSYEKSVNFLKKKIKRYENTKMSKITKMRQLNCTKQMLESKRRICQKLITHVQNVSAHLEAEMKRNWNVVNENKLRLHDIGNFKKRAMIKCGRVGHAQELLENINKYESDHSARVHLMNSWCDYSLKCLVCKRSDITACRLRHCNHIICALCALRSFSTTVACPICDRQTAFIEYKCNGIMKLRRSFHPFRFQGRDMAEIRRTFRTEDEEMEDRTEDAEGSGAASEREQDVDSFLKNIVNACNTGAIE